MKNKKTFFARLATVLVLVAIAVLMYLLGRGHTVYVDNKKLDYEGTIYDTPYKVEVYVDGERVAKLYDKERGSATCIGPNFTMELVVTQEKGGDEEAAVSYTLKLPYSMDGIIINLPALMAGLPEEAYMSEFISTEEAEPAEEEVVIDEFGLDSIDDDSTDDSGSDF